MRPLLIVIAALLLATSVIAPPILEETGTISMTTGQGDEISVTFTENTSDGGTDTGGGGGGAPSGYNISAASASIAFDRLEPGTTYTLTTKSGAIYLKKVQFTVLTTRTGVTFTLQHLTNISEGVNLVPLPNGLKLLSLERLTYMNIISSDIGSPVIVEFTVPSSLLTTNGATSGNVIVYRYEPSGWRALPTTATAGASGIVFRAESPGMSYFALAASGAASPAPPAPPPETPPQTPPITGEVTNDQGTAAGTDDTTAPTETEEAGVATESAETGSTNYVPLFGIVVVIILGAAIAFYYLGERKQPPKQELQGVAEINENAFKTPDPIDQLRSYVEGELNGGRTRDEVIAELRVAGWPDNLIQPAIDQFSQQQLAHHDVAEPHTDYEKVNSFITQKLGEGYDIATIKSNLVRSGWNAALVESLLQDRHLEKAQQTAVYSEEALTKLRAFISSELKRGYPKERIKAALVGAGWQERVIDQELK